MDEKCPICFKSFPIAFLERHVNTCLDTLELLLLPAPAQETGDSGDNGADKLNQEDAKHQDAFAALGLKADSRKANDKAGKKGKASLTSILIAERRLKRKQEDLEREIKRQTLVLEKDVPPQTQTQVDSGPTQVTGLPEIDVESSFSKNGALENSQPTNTQHIPSTPELEEETRQKLKNQEFLKLRREAELPLAQRLRPKTLDDFFGQEKLVGPHGILRNIMSAENIPSFILWGVPGVGKTSLARIIASLSDYKFVEISGADSNAKKLKEAFANAQSERQLTGQKTILFLDEIHRFNKAVQDILLPVLEKGTITAIGATTENPSFTLNNALLSRMHTFVMEPLSLEALVRILNRGLYLINKTRKLVHKLHLIAISRDAIDYIARTSTGDSRVALNILESINAYLSGLSYKVISKKDPEKESVDVNAKVGVIKIGMKELKPLLETHNFHQMYDRVGENHYDTISAFHKSVRGSDADAAVFYLVRMIHGGEDPLFIARRMIVIASEDVGLRDSSCLPFAIAAMEAIQFVGMPEGEIILAHCAVKLANAPKSTKSYRALRGAQSLLKENPDVMKLPIPMHLRNAPTKLMKELGYGDTYKYNPNYKHGKAAQVYLPPELKDTKFVDAGHFRDADEDDISAEQYQELDKERQTYEDYKKAKRQKTVDDRNKQRSLTRKATSKLIADDRPERLSSYDEFLDRSDQPEYFDGTERDNHSDDPEASHNFECSYDEFVDNGGERKHALNVSSPLDYQESPSHYPDSPIYYDEMTT